MAMTDRTDRLVKTGYKNGNTNYPINLYVCYKISQNTSTNQSILTLGMYFTQNAGSVGAWTDSSGSYLGTTSDTFSGSIPNTNNEEYWLVENKTMTVSHNNDGTGSATIYWKWGINSSWGGMVRPSGSFTITLPTIPRASSITAVGNVTLGNKCSVKWTPSDSSFKYKLTFSLGTWKYTTAFIEPKTTSAYTYKGYTIPADDTLYNLIPKSTGTMSVTLTTYNKNEKQVGSASAAKTFTVKIPIDVTPAIGEISLQPSVSGQTFLIQGKNKLTISVDECSAGMGSSIKSYTFEGPGISATTTKTSVTSSSVISDVGELTYIVKVTDNRDRTDYGTVTIQCYAYSIPYFKTFDAYRVSLNENGEYVKDDKGECIKCIYSIAYSHANETNTISSLNIPIKDAGEVIYNNLTDPIIDGDNATVEGSAIITKASVNSTYNVYAMIQDNYSNSINSKTKMIFGASKVVNVTEDGTGIAFGKMAESNNLFESKYKIKAPGLTSSRGTRPTSANIAPDDSYAGCVEYYLASNNMIEGKPASGNGHILHFHWDSTNGYDSQLHLKYNTGQMMTRGCDGDTWGDWRLQLDSENYTSYVSKKPTRLFSGSTSGGTLAITLDSEDSLDNYNYLEIFYSLANGDGHSSERIYSPNGKKLLLNIASIGSAYAKFNYMTVYDIVGSANTVTITPDTTRMGYVKINNDSSISHNHDTNYIRITRVLGYK